MSVTITRLSDGATSTPYDAVIPYSIADESRNIETDLLSGDMAFTLNTPRRGTGELTFLYDNETDARAGRELHRVASAFTVADTERPGIDTTYVLAGGGQRLTLDEETLTVWTLVVSFREAGL